MPFPCRRDRQGARAAEQRRGLRSPLRLCGVLFCSAQLALPLSAVAEPRVLVFSRTAGFRHDSIPDGMALIASLGAQQGFAVEATEDAGVFLQAGLPYRSVVFLNTTGDVLSDEQQQALEHYVRSGGGWVGVHAAADTEYDWPFYGELLAGAWFRSHPAIQSARLEVDVAGSFYPCCDHWEPAFVFEDEWYNFRLNPRLAAAVLLRLDESSYDPGPDAMGGDHPIAWQRGIDSGRAFYTGLGHRRETFADAGFRRHLGSAILWTGRLPPGDCDDDGAVDVAELLIGVDIALLRQPIADCRAAFDVNRDGAVTAEELVEAVAGPPDLAQRPAGALRAAG